MCLLEPETAGEFERSMKRVLQSVRATDKSRPNGCSGRRTGRAALPVFR
jgi:hypothetical protein